MAETRKLAAILAADVAGYSKLAGADEKRTLARLRALRSDLIDPTIALHHGRVVKRTGDGMIIEFRSVVDAVRCAIEVQNGMVERNAGLPPERRIEFRVGILLGDVVEESDGDLMGDGVNVAARLEEPGGFRLSEDGYRQVRDRLKEEFIDLGDKQLKNIARSVRAYAIKTGSSGPAGAGPILMLSVMLVVRGKFIAFFYLPPRSVATGPAKCSGPRGSCANSITLPKFFAHRLPLAKSAIPLTAAEDLDHGQRNRT